MAFHFVLCVDLSSTLVALAKSKILTSLLIIGSPCHMASYVAIWLVQCSNQYDYIDSTTAVHHQLLLICNALSHYTKQ